MVICEVISCINSNWSRHRVLLNLLRKTGRFGLKPHKSPGKMFWGWHLYVPRRMSHPSYPKTSISLSTARRLTLAWSEKLEVIKILSRRTYWARTGPMTVRILIVVQPFRVRFYRSCGRKSHGKIPVKLSQSIVKTTSLCYQMFFRDIDRWKSTKRK